MNFINIFKKAEKKITIVIMLTGAIFLIWRAKYGYCFNDEPFIISVAHRLVRGDKLIFNEWHPSQLFGILIYPLVKIYLLITNNSTEGILLYMRYCFCVLWFLTALFLYLTLRKYTKWAILSFIYFILFAPLDYMTCSYTSFGIMSVIVLSCIIDNNIKEKNSIKKSIYIGIITAIAICAIVLCCPYFVIVYFIFVVLVVIFLLTNKIKKSYYLLVIIINALCCATIGLISVYCFSLKGHSLNELLVVIPQILNDPQHEMTLIEKIKDTLSTISVYSLLPFSIGIILFFKYFKNKNEKNLKTVCYYWVLFFILTRLLVIIRLITGYYFNYEMFDIAVIGLLAYTLLKNKPKRLFWNWYIVGILYTICAFCASNTCMSCLSAAMVPCGAVGIIFIIFFIKEQYDNPTIDNSNVLIENNEQTNKEYIIKKYCIYVAIIFFLGQFGTQIVTRLYRQYWDYRLPYLTETIECGAARGLITSEKSYDKYIEEYNALNELLEFTENKNDIEFLSLENNPVIYLDANLNYGTFSTWTFGYDSLDDTLNMYFQLFPDKIPSVVYYSDKEKDIVDKLNIFDNYETFSKDSYHIKIKNK